MLLLDASVWIAAFDRDDPFYWSARKLVLSREHVLGALDLAFYEVSNVVGAVKGKRQLADRMCRLIVKRSRYNLVRISPALAEQATSLAAEHTLTAYDAAYLAAARLHEWTLVSADIRDLVKPGLAIVPDDALVADKQPPVEPRP
jgi:predicted nucleic acid-binding protein